MALDDFQNKLNEAQGLGEILDFLGFGGEELPWEDEKYSKNEAFWKPIDLMPSRWNELYPYRLLVVDSSKGNGIFGEGFFVGSFLGDFSKDNSGIQYVLGHQEMSGSWELTLPITPQQLQIQDQFAINTSATMRGIVEEHNGIKFKMSSAQGTTGIWPNRPTVGGIPKPPSALASVFGGALNSLNKVADNFKRIGRAFSGDHPAKIAPAVTPAKSDVGSYSTGYFQAMLLGQFLERYAQLKKNPNYKHLRLVFDIPKQNKSFIVTPVNFSLRQNAQKPMEYMWNMQLKAWKRIELTAPAPASNELFKLGKSNLFARLSGTIA